jgi:hypothetical protein
MKRIYRLRRIFFSYLGPQPSSNLMIVGDLSEDRILPLASQIFLPNCHKAVTCQRDAYGSRPIA